MRMRIKQMLGVSVCALILAGAFDVKAADDSYVDLSVLNNLQPGDSLFVETQPLFPIVKKDTVSTPKFKKAKKKRIKKSAKKAQEVKQKIKTEENVKAEEKIEKIDILPQAPIVPQPLAEKQEVEVKPEPQVSTTAPQITAPAQQEVKKEDEVSSKANSTELEVSEQPTEAVQPLTQSSLSEPKEKALPETIPVENSPKEVKEETIKGQEILTEDENGIRSATAETTATVPTEAEEPNKVIQPLIPQATTPAEGIDKDEIRFAEGSYEISEENAQKILALISAFENPQQNKIAIYAYNYDNGENSFKKKKLSLDRATEIRSLLLNKGYKNFSIKVINVTDSPDKSNLVEIEEIK